MCWLRFSFVKDGNSMIRRHDRHCLSPMEELIHHFTICADQDFLSQRRKLDDLKHMIGIAFHQWKNWSTTLRYVLIKIFPSQRRKLFDLKHIIGNAFHQWKNWSPFHDLFTICAGQDFPLSKTETRWFERHDRHCLLDDSKDMIGIAFHQWKNWSPLYEMCWSRFSCLKDGTLMTWSTWSALPFTNERTDHHFTICAYQDCPSSKDGNSMIWSTRSALPFTNERTDHHFTICADQDFPLPKTETRWFEAHDRHCLSPMKELITALRDVLIKIFLSQRRNLDDLKHMIGIAFHQWKKWSPV